MLLLLVPQLLSKHFHCGSMLYRIFASPLGCTEHYDIISLSPINAETDGGRQTLWSGDKTARASHTYKVLALNFQPVFLSVNLPLGIGLAKPKAKLLFLPLSHRIRWHTAGAAATLTSWRRLTPCELRIMTGGS